MNTPIQDPIAHACRLLREAAEELKSGHTLAKTGHDWTGEPEAKAAYDEHHAVADALERWESAIGAGGVEPLRRRECLHQIAEPAGERTAKDSAIEHAEYMAQDAERLLSAINTLNAQCDEDGAAFDEAEQAQAEEAVSEAFRAMRSGIHEFRKRRDRAKRAQAAPACKECDGTGTVAGSQAHFACPQCKAAPAAVAGPSEILEKINSLISSINETHRSQNSEWRQGCFDAADNTYKQIKDMLYAAPTTQAAPMESVLIDGVAYQTPAPVAAELLRLHIDARQAASQQEARELCPSCKNGDIYACTCTFPTAPQAAPQPAPIFGDENHVLVPQMLLSAACSAIDKKREGSKVLSELRRYTTGDLSKAARQPAVQQGEDAEQRCQHCIDRRDGFYGSWAPDCQLHDEDGNPRAARAQAKEGASHG